MRNEFGERSKAFRARLGLSQTEFAKRIDEPITRVSNLEYGRTNIGDGVLQKYVDILCSTDGEADELREKAAYSNRKRALIAKNEPLPSLQALFSLYGDKLSERATSKIRSIIERDVGEKTNTDIKVLNLQNLKATKRRRTQKQTRALLTPDRFAEVALHADEIRRLHFSVSERTDLTRLFEEQALELKSFDYDVVEEMPDFARESYACALGEKIGIRIFARREIFERAEQGNPFARFALGHEFGHVALHSNLLKTDQRVVINFQPSVSFDGEGTNQEYLASPEEEEAEVFSTFLLVPLEKLVGKPDGYLNRDYGIPDGKTKHCVKYYTRNQTVLDRVRYRLYDRGDHDHPLLNS